MCDLEKRYRPVEKLLPLSGALVCVGEPQCLLLLRPIRSRVCRGGIFTKKQLAAVRRKARVDDRHESLSSRKSVRIRGMRMVLECGGWVGESVGRLGIRVVVVL